MSQLQFQLDFLDDIVGTLRRMAGEHEDMARSLHHHAGAAQSIGAGGWVVDQVRYAASLLGGHPDLFVQLALELDHRLHIAHQVADEWDGATNGLRVALTGVMVSTTGLLGQTQRSTKANQSAQKTEKNAVTSPRTMPAVGTGGIGSLPSALLFSPYVPENDCFAYVKSVMTKMGSRYVPVVADSTSWLDHTDAGTKKLVKTGFAKVDGDPPTTSFFQMGVDRNGAQHSGVYLGSANGEAYIAHANWGFDKDGNALHNPQGIYRVDSAGHSHPVYAPQADGSVIGSPDQVPTNLTGGPGTGAREELSKFASNAGFQTIGLFSYVGQETTTNSSKSGR